MPTTPLADPLLNPAAPTAATPSANSMNRQFSAPASHQAHAQPQQPFPGRQHQRQAPPNTLNIHSVPEAPTVSAHNHLGGLQPQPRSAPSSACVPPPQLMQQMPYQPYNYPPMREQPPPSYEFSQQQRQFHEFIEQQRSVAAQAAQAAAEQAAHAQASAAPNDDEEEESLSESESEEPLDMWSCIMCTFRNHPQLNVCEACENVRIQPGMIRIVHSGADNANNASSPATAAPTIA